VDARLRQIHCMGASDPTRDPTPGAYELHSSRARPFGARAVPPCSSGLSRKLSGLPPTLPTPLLVIRLTNHDSAKRSWCKGGPKKKPLKAGSWRSLKADTREEAARSFGFFPSYLRCLAGEGQRTCTNMPTAGVCVLCCLLWMCDSRRK
jgi:hypothetical protein